MSVNATEPKHPAHYLFAIVLGILLTSFSYPAMGATALTAGSPRFLGRDETCKGPQEAVSAGEAISFSTQLRIATVLGLYAAINLAMN